LRKESRQHHGLSLSAPRYCGTQDLA
jgi:hypothetical protein